MVTGDGSDTPDISTQSFKYTTMCHDKQSGRQPSYLVTRQPDCHREGDCYLTLQQRSKHIRGGVGTIGSGGWTGWQWGSEGGHGDLVIPSHTDRVYTTADHPPTCTTDRHTATAVT